MRDSFRQFTCQLQHFFQLLRSGYNIFFFRRILNFHFDKTPILSIDISFMFRKPSVVHFDNLLASNFDVATIETLLTEGFL